MSKIIKARELRTLSAAASALLGFFATTQAWGFPAPGVEVREILRSAATTSGQPITLPEGAVETVVARYQIAPGAALPVHKHPYARICYVLTGSLEVTNLETHRVRVFTAGEAIVEDINQWHAARNLQPSPVELLVIDLAPPGAATTIPRQ